MQRRELLAGVAGVGVLAGGGALAAGAVPSFEDDEPEPTDPIDVETIEARGSDAGSITIPADDQLTVLTFFATTCGSCETKMPELAAAADSLESEPVRFVSATAEDVGDGLPEETAVEWFESHGGDWTLAHDADFDLTVAYDGLNYPKTIALDTDGRPLWEHTGVADADELTAGIEGALADAPGLE